MKIVYYEEDDTLFIEFQKGQIVRDESMNWNINIGCTEKWTLPFANRKNSF